MGVQKKPCKSCPYRKDSELWLRDEGWQFLRTVISRERFPCHNHHGGLGENICYGSQKRWMGSLDQYPELVGSVDEFIEKHLPAFEGMEDSGWDDMLAELLREAARDLKKRADGSKGPHDTQGSW